MLAHLLAAQLLVATTPPAALALESDPLPADKAAHAAVSYGLTMTGALLLEKLEVPRWRAVLYSSAGSLLLGLFKEAVLDDEISGGDLAADAIGTGLGAAVVLSFEL